MRRHLAAQLTSALGLMKNIAFAIALVTGLAADPCGSISDSELSLGGVALGDAESQVLAALGQPTKQSDTGEGIALEYPGLTVLVGWLEQVDPGVERHVLQLNATGRSACTPSGVCPGAPVATAWATYGQPVEAERSYGSFLEYYSKQSSCWLQLGTSGDTIHAINAVCQP